MKQRNISSAKFAHAKLVCCAFIELYTEAQTLKVGETLGEINGFYARECAANVLIKRQSQQL
jgi:hypothetical protein